MIGSIGFLAYASACRLESLHHHHSYRKLRNGLTSASLRVAEKKRPPELDYGNQPRILMIPFLLFWAEEINL